jgi:imidazolonepropionase-like amidohydrolase
LTNLGCGELLAKYAAKALSCDHCEHTSEASAVAMGAAGCVAVLLPTANYFIGEVKIPPIATFRAAGVRMAVHSNDHHTNYEHTDDYHTNDHHTKLMTSKLMITTLMTNTLMTTTLTTRWPPIVTPAPPPVCPSCSP